MLNFFLIVKKLNVNVNLEWKSSSMRKSYAIFKNCLPSPTEYMLYYFSHYEILYKLKLEGLS